MSHLPAKVSRWVRSEQIPNGLQRQIATVFTTKKKIRCGPPAVVHTARLVWIQELQFV